MERPSYIPLEKDVRRQLKQIKGIKTYSQYLKELIKFYNLKFQQTNNCGYKLEDPFESNSKEQSD